MAQASRLRLCGPPYNLSIEERVSSFADDYKVIARAVRGPMRRWWRTVGVWWMVLICLLLAALAVVSAYEFINPFMMPRPPLLEWVGLPHWLIIPLASLLWLLAAFRVLAAFDGLADATPAEGSDKRFTVYRFRLALSQAGRPLILIGLYGVLLAIRFSVPLMGSDYWSVSDTCSVLARCDMCLDYLTYMVWIAALLAIRPMPRNLVWLWWMGPLVSGWVHNFVVFTSMQAGLHLRYPMAARIELGEPTKAALPLLGFALLAYSVFLVASHRRAGTRLALAIGIITVLGALNLGAASHIETEYYDVRFLVDYLMTHLYALAAWQPLLWIRHWEVDNTSQFWLYTAGHRLELPANPWLFWLPWVFQAAIVYGYFKLVEWLIVSGVAKRKRATTAE